MPPQKATAWCKFWVGGVIGAYHFFENACYVAEQSMATVIGT